MNPLEFDYDFMLLLMIFLRMTGCVFFNPIMGRKNMPPQFKVGLTLMLSLYAYTLVPPQPGFEITSVLVLMVTGIKELLTGYLIGFIIQAFFAVVVVAGDLMDMQIGISMSKIYDPQSNVSMALSASFFNVLMMFIFFALNGHLTIVKIFTQLAVMLPYGDHMIGQSTFGAMVSLLSTIFVYAIKMSLPIVAAELIAEIAVGLLMKAVPQVDIFMVNIQLKVLIGFVVFLVLIPPMGMFLEKLITIMFDNINQLFTVLI